MDPNDIDLQAVGREIKNIADREIVGRFHKLDQEDIRTKADGDRVCIADLKGEEAAGKYFKGLLPDCLIVGEEACSENPSILSQAKNHPLVVYLDMLDGTHNFIDGRCDFASMAAVTVKGEPIASWIYYPDVDHPFEGEIMAAKKGGGVFLNGNKAHLAADNPCLCTKGLVSSRLRQAMNTESFAKAAALLYPLEIGGPVSCMYRRLFKNEGVSFLIFGKAYPWDHLPGLLMVEEAGGCAINLREGRRYDLECKKGLLVAHDAQMIGSLYGIIEGVKDILTNDNPASKESFMGRIPIRSAPLNGS